MALLTVENLSAIYAMMEIGDDADKEEQSELVRWAEYSLTDDDNIGLLASGEVTKTAQSFVENSFLHGQNIDAKNADYIYKETIKQQH